jgi:hypothetical protein
MQEEGEDLSYELQIDQNDQCVQEEVHQETANQGSLLLQTMHCLWPIPALL